MAYCPMEIMER